MLDLGHLLTEQANPATSDLDALPTEEMLAVFNREDQKVAESVRKEIPQIARAVEAIASRMSSGGRLLYCGAGTSGRLGVLDASECPPTFQVPEDLVTAFIAGGDHALRHAVEGCEDSAESGAGDLVRAGFSVKDALVGIAASGRTPYVLGAIGRARELGGVTVGLSCSPDSALSKCADISIEPLPGPEVIAGSTRLKAGTATKLVLNMISSGVMIRLGYVYSNLMVNVRPSNEKLVDRAQRIIMQLTGRSRSDAARLLEESGRDVRTALLMDKAGVSRDEARALLAQSGGRVRDALVRAGSR